MAGGLGLRRITRLDTVTSLGRRKSGSGLPGLSALSITHTVTTPGYPVLTSSDLNAGETYTAISPNDGRLALDSTGLRVLRGLTAASTGTANYTLTTSAGRTRAFALTTATALRQVADNCSTPLSLSASKSASGSTPHRVYAAVNGNLQIEWANCYGVNNAGPGATTNIRLGVEYPIGSGTIYPVNYSGVRDGTIPDGGRLLSDAVSGLVMPALSSFRLRSLRNNTVGLPVSRTGNQLTGEGFATSGTVNALGDNTTSGAATTGSSSSGAYPSAIVIAGTHPAVFNDGDSRSFGALETPDTYGEHGEVARSLAGYVPCINAGISSQSAAQVLASSGNKTGMAAYCSDVIVEMGVNTFYNEAKTLAAAQVDAVNLWTLYANGGARVWQTVISPSTTGSWTSDAGQTIPKATVPAYMAWLRDGAPMLNGAAVAVGSNATGTVRAGAIGHLLAGIFDTAAAVESAIGSGKWASVYGPATPDGLHANMLGSGLIRDSVGGTGIVVAPLSGAPAVYRARVLTATPAQIRIQFNSPLRSDIVPAASAFTITNTGGADTVTGVAVSGNIVTLTKSRTTLALDFLSVSYTPPSTNPLQDAFGRQVLAFTGLKALNYLQPSDAQPVRLTTLASLVEVTDPDWGYDYLPSLSNNYTSTTTQGVSAAAIPAGQAGFVEMTLAEAVGNGPGFGLKTANTIGGYTTITAGVLVNGGSFSSYRALVAGAITAPNVVRNMADGDIIRIVSNGAGTVTIQVSSDNRNTWNTIHTLTGQSTGPFYAGVHVPAGAVIKLAGSANFA